MPRERLIMGLERIQAELTLISGMIENAIITSLESLINDDKDLAERVIREDDTIDERTNAVEEMCIDLIRREAPVAGDLRRIVAIMQMVNELERIGDYAEGIAKIAVRMSGKKPVKPLIDIPKMRDITLQMLKNCMKLHMSDDVEFAKETFGVIYKNDDAVDSLYEKIVLELMEHMRDSDDSVERCTYLLWVAHNVERMADRMVNISEKAYYEVVGEQPPT